MAQRIARNQTALDLIDVTEFEFLKAEDFVFYNIEDSSDLSDFSLTARWDGRDLVKQGVLMSSNHSKLERLLLAYCKKELCNGLIPIKCFVSHRLVSCEGGWVGREKKKKKKKMERLKKESLGLRM